MATSRPRVLIEDWLPVAELGIESRRENAAKSALPPNNFLHIWWARRPLVASTAVVLAGLLPSWSSDLADSFPTADEVRSDKDYKSWLLRLVGVLGDPISARAAYDAAKAAGVRIPNPYTYRQAFRNSPSDRDLDLLHRILRKTWGDSLPLVADPTAGGGSIPWVASRMGLPVFANDLNGVAASILRLGVKSSSERGLAVSGLLDAWSKTLLGRVSKRLAHFFPSEPGESVATYLFVNAVPCPRTGRVVPLLTDKWLRKGKGVETAVRVHVSDSAGNPLITPSFEIVQGRDLDRADASIGFVKGGKGISPYDGLVIDGEYIKSVAQKGEMTQILYAVVFQKSDGKRYFRAPQKSDLDAISAAETEFDSIRPVWQAEGILPDEEIPQGNKTAEAINMGMTRWIDFFTKRQALAHGVFVEELRSMLPEMRQSVGEIADDVYAVMAFAHSKALNRNAKLSTWDLSGQRMRSVFDSHNFAFKWTFAEFESANQLFGWSMQNTIKAYRWLSELIDESGLSVLEESKIDRDVRVTKGSGATLALEEQSVAHICIDPPYYDNVMYAELADFFYVWEKRTLGYVFDEYFTEELTDKDNEAVANPSRFAAMGRRKKELADLDYEAKMTAIFTECKRTLRDDGVLSVMFTHKRAEAWDTLGTGLLQAGFSIETSWPVNTESENSIHQKNMNSAASTIMLVCRKREERIDEHKTYLDDIEHDIRQAARDAATRFQYDGIEGVDLLLSTYGPTLSVISQHWPVYSSTPDADGRDQLLRPEDALALAREEIVDLRRSRLVGQAAKVDGLTDFVLLAWDTFGAREFPFDTARLLALAVGGLDVDELERAKIVSKASGKVKLMTPKERLRREADSGLPGVTPEASSFEFVIDAVDTALYIAEVDGQQAAKRFLDRHGYTSDAGFISTLQGLANAIPRTKVKGAWVVPEAGLIDTLCTLYFDDVVLPEAEEMAAPTGPNENTLFDVE